MEECLKTPSELHRRSLFYPGRWMTEPQLTALREDILAVARSCSAEIPRYGVFLPQRRPFENRIITFVYGKNGAEPAGFTAMVALTAPVDGKRLPVLHLGLVMVSPSYRRQKLMIRLYHRTLIEFLARRAFRPFWITSLSQEPAIVGAVSDSFRDVYPHYEGKTRLTASHQAVARSLMREHGHEFGEEPGAELDERSFVVRGSCAGASQALRTTFMLSAKYRVASCNVYCARALDYARGDEVLQVGRMGLDPTLKNSTRLIQRWRRTGRQNK
jgi:GNAT superfamily N-acetyltransferase